MCVGNCAHIICGRTPLLQPMEHLEPKNPPVSIVHHVPRTLRLAGECKGLCVTLGDAFTGSRRKTVWHAHARTRCAPACSALASALLMDLRMSLSLFVRFLRHGKML